MLSNDALSKDLTVNFSKYMHEYKLLYESLTETCSQFLKNKTGSIILDLGSGPGILTVMLDQEFPLSTIIGLEPSIDMLQSIDHIDYQKYNFIQGKVQYVPIKSARVDLIVSRYSIPYWIKLDDAFQEIIRILKPGGRIIFEALNKSIPYWKLKTIQFSMTLKKAPKDVIKYHIDAYQSCFTPDELEKILQKYGLMVIHKEYKKNDWRFLIVGEKPQN